MNETEIGAIVQRQRSWFQSGKTLSVKGRVEALQRLQGVIRAHEGEIHAALRQDLGKSGMESYMCETGLALSELRYMIAHTERFAGERRVRTPLAQFASRSYVKPSPYGTVLIMSPWNYPFLLAVDPLIDAIAAGNTVVVKPSAYSPATSEVLSRLLGICFDPQLVSVVTGGRQENASLLDQKFDMIFFTGSQAVGKEVLRRAAEHLTPAVLELGGKSPCIVDQTAKLPLAAKRIVFAKFLNCGQTCVAPDYILCHESVRDQLAEELKRQIVAQFGSNPLQNQNYGKIINQKHFDRICGLIQPEKVVCGGTWNAETLRIAPTVMTDVSWDDPVMGQEIFGPVLPILTYRDTSEIIDQLADRSKPLAFYVFSEDHRRIQELTTRCSFGGGCVNDAVIHIATTEMGFGGVGESGMGAYHGKTGFEAFTHNKSIVDKKTWLDLAMRYQPYQRSGEKLLRMFLR
jgi:aldehyde dehydrogenase (NAD+)